jgi:hypothetical protein
VNLVHCLGQFIPTVLDRNVIANELAVWLSAHGILKAKNQGKHLPVAVRSPAEQPVDPYIYKFHHDNCDHLVMWSNGTATYLRDRMGTSYHPEPFDVVLIDDRLVEHKAPPHEAGRWFARLIDPIF